ncbi:DUF1476 domain-containing protein [Rhodobacteraceae bacterium RKSG542]|uniref:DUF1476 domain-containing protein n=1 Tax=Pseudovibrio flavus TaxID=2529854 RepID=UPI0012BD584F|nr:DUF1476 domain-containing protein [Pseudovibrio flavus]MTI19317.1 DUF1476 domain-containing protein [Pseudovibrio flavus]
MTTFDRREESFEGGFSAGQEQRFKAEARRNKLLGLWAAEKMGLSGEEATAFAVKLVQADLERPGHEEVFTLVSEAFAAKGVEQSEHQIRRTMDQLLAKAELELSEKA